MPDDSHRSLSSALIALPYRAWSATWRIARHGEDLLRDALAEGPAVLAFWHGEQAAMVRAHAGMGLVGLASRSPDGALLAGVIARLGYRVERGSSSRGGAMALRSCSRLIERHGLSPALAVDGPRGPWHEPQLGAVALSAMTGRPIVYGVARSHWAWRLRSWDRFELPLPGSRVDLFYGRMEPPARDRASIEAARQDLRSRMEALGTSGTDLGS